MTYFRVFWLLLLYVVNCMYCTVCTAVFWLSLLYVQQFSDYHYCMYNSFLIITTVFTTVFWLSLLFVQQFSDYHYCMYNSFLIIPTVCTTVFWLSLLYVQQFSDYHYSMYNSFLIITTLCTTVLLKLTSLLKVFCLKDGFLCNPSSLKIVKITLIKIWAKAFYSTFSVCIS